METVIIITLTLTSLIGISRIVKIVLANDGLSGMLNQ